MDATALLLSKELEFTVGTRAVREPAEGEVLVGVHWAGVCGSDLHVLKTGDWVAYWPATLGHEVAGEVLASGATELPVGTPVVLDSRVPRPGSDGKFRADRLDPDLEWLGEAYPGGYAEALVVPAVSVRAVPAGTDTGDAVLAEPLAVVMCALEQVRTAPTRVLVLGHGPIGALTHAEIGMRWPEAEITVVEPNPHRADMARSMAAADVLPARDDQLFDLIVDAAGYPSSLPDAVGSTRHGGTIALIALPHQPTTIQTSDIVERSLAIVGSVGFDDRHLDEALDRIATTPERYRRIVTHRLEFDDVPAFLAEAVGDAGKVLIRCRP